MKRVEIQNWGLISYASAWDRQLEAFKPMVDKKLNGQVVESTIVLCQHPHVYTIGKSGKDQNMLLSGEQLKRIDATLYHTDRGGDITYHGPGQVVCYPLLDLEQFNLGLRSYIELLEEAVIRVCADYGIEASRLDKATGVWLDSDLPTARKICAIGVRCSRHISMHGLAFNVATDLTYFSYINPCGFIDKGVTSLSKELGREISLEEVELNLLDKLKELLAHALGGEVDLFNSY